MRFRRRKNRRDPKSERDPESEWDRLVAYAEEVSGGDWRIEHQILRGQLLKDLDVLQDIQAEVEGKL